MNLLNPMLMKGSFREILPVGPQKVCLKLPDGTKARSVRFLVSEAERRDFWGICEDRHQTRSTILTSQLPVARWHEQIGDPTAADGILDRLIHNAHRIELHGESMRKRRGPKGGKDNA